MNTGHKRVWFWILYSGSVSSDCKMCYARAFCHFLVFINSQLSTTGSVQDRFRRRTANFIDNAAFDFYVALWNENLTLRISQTGSDVAEAAWKIYFPNSDVVVSAYIPRKNDLLKWNQFRFANDVCYDKKKVTFNCLNKILIIFESLLLCEPDKFSGKSTK